MKFDAGKYVLKVMLRRQQSLPHKSLHPREHYALGKKRKEDSFHHPTVWNTESQLTVNDNFGREK